MFIMLEVSWESHEECCVAGLPWAVEVRGFPLLACLAPERGRGQYKTKTTPFLGPQLLVTSGFIKQASCSASEM